MFGGINLFLDFRVVGFQVWGSGFTVGYEDLRFRVARRH